MKKTSFDAVNNHLRCSLHQKENLADLEKGLTSHCHLYLGHMMRQLRQFRYFVAPLLG